MSYMKKNNSKGWYTDTIQIISAFLLVLYMVAKPFYIFPSGNPQICDFIISLVFFLYLLDRHKLNGEIFLLLKYCFLFAAYAFVVNSMWGIIISDINMLKPPLFYFFNTVLVYVILVFHAKSGKQVVYVLVVGVLLSGLCQFLLSFIVSNVDIGRQVIFFNNPNQLGYWAMLSATIFCVIARKLQIKLFYQIITVGIFFYICSLSLSKAAILSYILLVIIHFSRSRWHFLVAGTSIVLLIILVADLTVLERMVERLETIGEQSDDSMLGRGYGRIWDYPQFLVVGAGEFGLQRFEEEDAELHSTFGTILFSYGIVGTLLFGLIIWRIYGVAGLSTTLYLIPAFAYGLTHQGLRFSLLWILFALLAVSSVESYMVGFERKQTAHHSSKRTQRFAMQLSGNTVKEGRTKRENMRGNS